LPPKTWKLEIFHGNSSRSACAPSRTAFLALLLLLPVCCEIERDEQEEVGAQYSHSSKGREFFTGTFAHVWYPWEVGRSEIRVGGKVDEAEVNNELDNLEHCDIFLPPDPDAASRLEVVPVHDNMYGKVEGDRYPGDRSVANKLGVAEESGSAVVVGMKKG
jgi:hypothetical protein